MGVVDILINNAGLLPQDPSRDTEPSNVRRMMDINVLSHFWVEFWNLFLMITFISASIKFQI